MCIEDSEILLIQKEILVEYVEADKYRNIISKNTDITLWYSRSPKELYCLYFIVNKLINKNIEVVGLDKKNIENQAYILINSTEGRIMYLLECSDTLLSYIVGFTGKTVLAEDFE